MRSIILILIRSYRLFLSPWMGGQCRFFPTCSYYAEEAVQIHGSWKGLGLALQRIAKCHPWHPGGIDPVPQPPGSVKHG